MRSSKLWFIAFAFLLVFALSGSSALATSYIKGYVRPSGDGGSCSGGGNCMQFDASFTDSIVVDLFGVTSTQTFSSDQLSFLSQDEANAGQTIPHVIDALPLNLLGIQPGSVLTFVFAQGLVPDPSTSGVTFGILGCGGTLLGTNIGGIFNSGFPPNTTQTLVSTICTNVPDVTTVIGDGTGTGNSVSFTVNSGINIPQQFAFSFPDGELPVEIDVTSASVPIPEPASLSLLAAGLIGLGVIRRKRSI